MHGQLKVLMEGLAPTLDATQGTDRDRRGSDHHEFHRLVTWETFSTKPKHTAYRSCCAANTGYNDADKHYNRPRTRLQGSALMQQGS